MGRCDDILLVSDFDRTLTNQWNEIPAANIEAIRAFIREGGMFTVATGQSSNMHRKRYDRVPMSAPCIVFNGAAVYDYEKNQAVYVEELPESAGQMAQQLTTAFPDCVVTLETLQDQYLLQGVKNVKQQTILNLFGMGKRKQGMPDRENENWLKIVIMYLNLPDTEEEIAIHLENWQEKMKEMDFFRDTDETTNRKMKEIADWIEARFPGEYTVSRSMPMMLEAHTAGVNKGTTARRLAQMYGRTKLVCVGDAPNDVGMLDEADEAYIAADGDVSLLDGRYHMAASSSEGTVASVIEMLMTHP